MTSASAHYRANAHRVVALDPRADDRWLRLAASPAGSLFTSPPWISAVCGTYGFRPEARVAVDGTGAPVAGFTWAVVDDLRGTRMVSLPFSDRAEPLYASGGMWRELARDCLGSEVPFRVRCFEDSPVSTSPGMTRAGEAAWHGTPLTAPLDVLMERFSGSVRRNIRLSRRRGVRVLASTERWALHAFHRLHVGLRKRKYRMLAQPLGFLDRVWEEFSPRDGVVTFLAYVDEEIVAGAVHLVWNDVLYYKYSASDLDRLTARPNEAIASAAIEWAVQRGLTCLDWGLSDLDQPGLLAYKRGWGCVEKRIVTWRSRPSDGTGAGDGTEAGRLLAGLTELLTDDGVPDDVTAAAGSLLYRDFC
jgi:CelD/BcsL family acetyltransferase involved in cellulose biosynthesis